jgi:hypothetical protein
VILKGTLGLNSANSTGAWTVMKKITTQQNPELATGLCIFPVKVHTMKELCLAWIQTSARSSTKLRSSGSAIHNKNQTAAYDPRLLQAALVLSKVFHQTGEIFGSAHVRLLSALLFRPPVITAAREGNAQCQLRILWIPMQTPSTTAGADQSQKGTVKLHYHDPNQWIFQK